jgi:hypothetical protein
MSIRDAPTSHYPNFRDDKYIDVSATSLCERGGGEHAFNGIAIFCYRILLRTSSILCVPVVSLSQKRDGGLCHHTDLM